MRHDDTQRAQRTMRYGERERPASWLINALKIIAGIRIVSERRGTGRSRSPYRTNALTRGCMLGITLLTTCAASAFAQESLTLDQAIAQALQHNRLIKNDEIEVAKSAERIEIARTRRLPEFEINALGLQPFTPLDFRFNRGSLGLLPGNTPFPLKDTRIGNGFTPVAFVGARVSQPITQLRRVNLGVELETLNQRLAETKLEAQRRNVTNQIKRAYFAVLQTQSALGALEDALKLHRELDRVVGEYVVQKVVLPADGLDVKTQLAQDEYETVRLRNALAAQKEQLNQLRGSELTAEFAAAPAADLALAEFDLKAAQTRALEHRAELQEARLKQQQASVARRLKQAEELPEVSLTAGTFAPLGLEFVPRTVTGVGVSLKWEPYDWGRRKRERALASRVVEQADNLAREAETQILLDVNTRFRKLTEARALLRVAQAAQTASTEKLRVATNRFKQESALFKDVLQTQAAVADANHQYQQALLAFLTARADFEKALGEP